MCAGECLTHIPCCFQMFDVLPHLALPSPPANHMYSLELGPLPAYLINCLITGLPTKRAHTPGAAFEAVVAGKVPRRNRGGPVCGAC